MKRVLFIFITCCVLLFSCSKNKMNSLTGRVQVRIENVTGFTMQNATVGTAIYGDVSPNHVTEYKILDKPVYAGYCSFMVNNIQSGAGVGVCGTPPPPAFEPGYYTFKVTPSANGYNDVTVIKN